MTVTLGTVLFYDKNASDGEPKLALGITLTNDDGTTGLELVPMENLISRLRSGVQATRFPPGLVTGHSLVRHGTLGRVSPQRPCPGGPLAGQGLA